MSENRVKVNPALETVRKILRCEHPTDLCPPLRTPSCRYALAYLEQTNPGFEAAWRNHPPAAKEPEAAKGTVDGET